MSILEAIRLALGQIRVQKLKSFFTLLGVTIGVMFLIAVVSIVEGMGRYMEEDFIGKLMGVNTFELRRRPNMEMGHVTEAEWRSWQRRPRLRMYDVEPVVAALPAGTRWSVESSSDNVVIETRGTKPRAVTATAIDGDYFRIKRIDVASGRLFSPQEQALGTPVVVIGDDIKSRFFPSVDALGRELRIGNIPYRVVGVAEKQGNIFGISLDRFVIAPAKSPLQRLVNPPGIIDAMTIQTPTGAGLTEAMERVRQVMRGRHKLRPSQPDDFSMQTSESALAFWHRIQRIMVMAGVVLPMIGLLVGAIVIMNIMLMSVSERTREIGIRKSLGARRRDIMWQFLVEAATLSTIGAAAGIALGIGLSKLVEANTFLPASVAPWSIGVAVLLGAGVGIVSGIYPASRAARLDPIAALRFE